MICLSKFLVCSTLAVDIASSSTSFLPLRSTHLFLFVICCCTFSIIKCLYSCHGFWPLVTAKIFDLAIVLSSLRFRPFIFASFIKVIAVGDSDSWRPLFHWCRYQSSYRNNHHSVHRHSFVLFLPITMKINYICSDSLISSVCVFFSRFLFSFFFFWFEFGLHSHWLRAFSKTFSFVYESLKFYGVLRIVSVAAVCSHCICSSAAI